MGFTLHKKTFDELTTQELQNNVLPLVKSVHAERIRENYDIFDFELTPQEMKAIDSMPGARFGGNPDTVEF